MARAASASSRLEGLPEPQSRTEWKLLSHHYIPASVFPAGAPSSSSTLVGLLDLYVTRKQRTILIVHGHDIDEQDDYQGSPHSHHRVPLPSLGPLLHCCVPDKQQNYLLNHLGALGVDPVSSRDISACFFKLARDADRAGVRELYAAVDVEITDINVVNFPSTDHDDDIPQGIWDSEEEEDFIFLRRSASKKSIMKLNEASFAAGDEASKGMGMCVVCLEDLSSAEGNNTDRRLTKLSCTHVFHNSCIVPWLERNGTCPICRRELVDD